MSPLQIFLEIGVCFLPPVIAVSLIARHLDAGNRERSARRDVEALELVERRAKSVLNQERRRLQGKLYREVE